ncbi:TPA: hypothetical protein HA361_05720 [Candidatus Woesearchaeota archaeon]|nr:hypothetical protein [Candidatus Woesearchaeota archaeon]
MDTIIFEQTIAGKKVRCIFIFGWYSKKRYEYDFLEFAKFHKEKKTRGDFIDYHLLKVREFKDIPYSYFRDYAARLFSESIFHMITEYPNLIISDELNIQIVMRRIPHWDYSFDSFDERFDERNACFNASGMWFLTNIVAPFKYMGRIEYTVIARYFLHELAHFVDIAEKRLAWDIGGKYEAKIVKMIGKTSAYSIVCLYNMLFNLREEGLAEFLARAASPEFNISGKAAQEFNLNLLELTKKITKKEATGFYVQRIGYRNLRLAGEYAIGRNMCLTIALAAVGFFSEFGNAPLAGRNAGRINLYFTVRCGKERWQTSTGEHPNKDPRKSINGLLEEGKEFYLYGIPAGLVTKAIEIIRPTNHYVFVRLYEMACDALHIAEENRMMTRKRFYRLVQVAKMKYEMQRKKDLEKGGFAYIPQENLPDINEQERIAELL